MIRMICFFPNDFDSGHICITDNGNHNAVLDLSQTLAATNEPHRLIMGCIRFCRGVCHLNRKQHCIHRFFFPVKRKRMRHRGLRWSLQRRCDHSLRLDQSDFCQISVSLAGYNTTACYVMPSKNNWSLTKKELTQVWTEPSTLGFLVLLVRPLKLFSYGVKRMLKDTSVFQGKYTHKLHAFYAHFFNWNVFYVFFARLCTKNTENKIDVYLVYILQSLLISMEKWHA